MSIVATVSAKALNLLKQAGDHGISAEEITNLWGYSGKDPLETTKIIKTFRTAVFTLRSNLNRIDFIDGRYYYKGAGEYSLFRPHPGDVERKIMSRKKPTQKKKKNIFESLQALTETQVPAQAPAGQPSSGSFIFAKNRQAFDKLKKSLSPTAQSELEYIDGRIEYFNKLSNLRAELRPYSKTVNLDLFLSGN